MSHRNLPLEVVIAMREAIADALLDEWQRVADHVEKRKTVEGHRQSGFQKELQNLHFLHPLTHAYQFGASRVEHETGKVWEKKHQAAVSYAKKRASDMAGISDNPLWPITETTEKELQKLLDEVLDGADTQASLKEQIEDHPSFHSLFGEGRAEKIVRTETTLAINQGTIDALEKAGYTHVLVHDGHGDPECLAVDGTIQTLEWAKDNLIAHPNCVRSFTGVRDVLSKEITTELGLVGFNLEGQRVKPYGGTLGHDPDNPCDPSCPVCNGISVDPTECICGHTIKVSEADGTETISKALTPVHPQVSFMGHSGHWITMKGGKHIFIRDDKSKGQHTPLGDHHIKHHPSTIDGLHGDHWDMSDPDTWIHKPTGIKVERRVNPIKSSAAIDVIDHEGNHLAVYPLAKHEWSSTIQRWKRRNQVAHWVQEQYLDAHNRGHISQHAISQGKPGTLFGLSGQWVESGNQWKFHRDDSSKIARIHHEIPEPHGFLEHLANVGKDANRWKVEGGNLVHLPTGAKITFRGSGGVATQVAILDHDNKPLAIVDVPENIGKDKALRMALFKRVAAHYDRESEISASDDPHGTSSPKKRSEYEIFWEGKYDDPKTDDDERASAFDPLVWQLKRAHQNPTTEEMKKASEIVKELSDKFVVPLANEYGIKPYHKDTRISLDQSYWGQASRDGRIFLSSSAREEGYLRHIQILLHEMFHQRYPRGMDQNHLSDFYLSHPGWEEGPVETASAHALDQKLQKSKSQHRMLPHTYSFYTEVLHEIAVSFEVDRYDLSKELLVRSAKNNSNTVDEFADSINHLREKGGLQKLDHKKLENYAEFVASEYFNRKNVHKRWSDVRQDQRVHIRGKARSIRGR